MKLTENGRQALKSQIDLTLGTPPGVIKPTLLKMSSHGRSNPRSYSFVFFIYLTQINHAKLKETVLCCHLTPPPPPPPPPYQVSMSNRLNCKVAQFNTKPYYLSSVSLIAWFGVWWDPILQHITSEWMRKWPRQWIWWRQSLSILRGNKS